MKKLLIFFALIFMRGFVYLAGKILFKLRVVGVDNLPSNHGAILVINHGSYLDFLIAACILPGKFSFVINAHIYRKKSLNWLFKAANCIPVGSQLGPEARDQFNEAVKEQISKGLYVCIFAEGTVTRTGQILEFKKGVEHLAMITNAPVLPVHFDNVVGSPFSWKPGSGKLIRFKIKGIRRPVNIAIGKALSKPISAFRLRQKVKELEVFNFRRRFHPSDDVNNSILKKIGGSSRGQWIEGEKNFQYSKVLFNISSISQILLRELENDEAVAVMLPGGSWSMHINLFLLLSKKTVVNIDPSYTNEERLFVCNTAGIRTIITSRDLAFTGYSPVTERVIYIEDVRESIKKGVPVKSCTATLSSAGRQFRKWFSSSNERDRVVSIFFEKSQSGELQGVPLTNLNIMAVLAGIKQSHFFDSSSSIYSDLPMYHSFGFVLQLMLPLYFDITWIFGIDSILPDKQTQRLVLLTPTQIKDKNPIQFLHPNDLVFTSEIHPSDGAIQTLLEGGIKVFTCAGQNETSSVFTINLQNFQGTDIEGKNLEHEAGESGSVGKPLPGVAIRICSDEIGQEECDPYIEGSIWVSGAAIATESIQQNENHKDKINNAWHNTGMRGYLNTKGFLHLLG